MDDIPLLWDFKNENSEYAYKLSAIKSLFEHFDIEELEIQRVLESLV